MTISSLRTRLADLEAQTHRRRVPTTTLAGQRVWIEGGGCGLRFLRNLTKAMRDNDILGELRVQCELWARAEVDGPNFGEIARLNRAQARCALERE
jgi:hypothetical protein